MNYGCKTYWPPLSPLDSVESKQPLQSRLLNTPIFIPFWDGPLHPSKCRKKLILICFKALQLSLIPVLGSWHLFLQTSYFSSLTKTLEWSIVLWLVNHSKSLNGQWLVSQSLILRPSEEGEWEKPWHLNSWFCSGLFLGCLCLHMIFFVGEMVVEWKFRTYS